MATQIDPNFVITAESFEGYRIVKYLGTVCGTTPNEGLSSKYLRESFSKNQNEMIKMAEGLGANAIISLRLMNLADTFSAVFYGTAVIIEPINK
jgi:uncharacterized protein YbjQ (UPF0145 family)